MILHLFKTIKETNYVLIGICARSNIFCMLRDPWFERHLLMYHLFYPVLVVQFWNY